LKLINAHKNDWLVLCNEQIYSSVGYSLQRIVIYTPWAIKKGATFVFTITLANVDRFQ